MKELATRYITQPGEISHSNYYACFYVLLERQEMETLVVPQRLNSAYIIIDTEKCKGCRFCFSVCPKGIIGVATQINQSGYTPVVVVDGKARECTGCISCAIMCPETAITVYRHNSEPH